MQTVWIMGNYSEVAQIRHPVAAGYLEYGGDAYGNDTFEPWYYHQ